jgi:hypothetical protein
MSKPVLSYEQERRVKEALTAAGVWKGAVGAILAHHVNLLVDVIRKISEPYPNFENKVAETVKRVIKDGVEWPPSDNSTPF